MPACFELRLWNGLPGGGRTKPTVDTTVAARYRHTGSRVPGSRVEGVFEPGRAGCGAYTQCISLLLFHPGGLSRRAHNSGTALARHDDGAVLRQGIPREHSAPLSVLQSVLARPGHHLDCHLQPGLPEWDARMSSEV